MNAETEEEISVDRQTDFYLIVLYLKKKEYGHFLSRTSLKGYLDGVQEGLPIQEWFGVESLYEDYSDFMSELHFLENIDAVESIEKQESIELTEKGMQLGGNLLDEMKHKRKSKLMSMID